MIFDIFNQFSIVSRITDYLDLNSLDNFESFPDEVVKYCCHMSKRELFKNTWLQFNYTLSKHPFFQTVNPYISRVSEKYLTNVHYGIYVYVTFDKNLICLNVESVYGNLVQFHYPIPEIFEDIAPDNDIYKMQCYTIPKFFSSRNNISHIVRARMCNTFIYFDIDIPYYFFDQTYCHLKPQFVIPKNQYDSDDEDLKFSQIFGDENIDQFAHLLRTSDYINFKHIEPMSSSFTLEVFIDEFGSDEFFYDDLVGFDALVFKFKQNEITNYLRIVHPFEHFVVWTKVLGQKFYAITNMDKTTIKIYNLINQFKDPDLLPLMQHTTKHIYDIKYVRDDCIALFYENDTNVIQLKFLYSKKETFLPQRITDLIDFKSLQITFVNDEQKNSVLMLFIDVNNKPQCVWLFSLF